MSSSIIEKITSVATSVEVSDETLTVHLSDGRTIAAPLAWYPRLAHGSDSERKQFKFNGNGRGIHWPMLDEDISVENLLRGQPSTESQKSLKKWLQQREQN